MAKEPTKVEIEGWTFEFFPMNPRECLKITTRLIKILGEPMGAIIDSAAKVPGRSLIGKILDGEIGQGGIANAFAAMANRLDEDEVWKTAALLLEKVHVRAPGDNGTRPINIDLDFNGDFPLFIKAVRASFEVHLGGFFIGALGGQILKTSPLTDI